MSDLILPNTFSISNPMLADKDDVVKQLKQFFQMPKNNQVTFLNAILKQETSAFLLSQERGIGFTMLDNDNDEDWFQFNPFIVENGDKFQLNINLDNTTAMFKMSEVSVDDLAEVKLNSFVLPKGEKNDE